MLPSPWRQLLAEFLGTFCLVFAGTGAIIVNDFSQNAITHLGIATAFGLVVFAMIYTFGEISGSHLNPAVSIGLWVAGKFDTRHVTSCMVLQGVFPAHRTLGMTLPAAGQSSAFLFEVLLTWMLMLVILNVTHPTNPHRSFAGFIIGAFVGLEALFGGPVSGASMNPARSLGPALVSGNMLDLWIYLIAPVVGSIVAVWTHRLLMLTAEPDKPPTDVVQQDTLKGN
jgi:aquaporin NIP